MLTMVWVRLLRFFAQSDDLSMGFQEWLAYELFDNIENWLTGAH